MSTTTAPSSSQPAHGFQMPAPTPEQLEVQRVANRLTELCDQGKYHEAMVELYADNARHIEALAMPNCPQVIEGKQALMEKGEQFARTTVVHGHSCSKPLVNGDQFTCTMTLDLTCKEGPMAGQRMNMSETCLYTVKNGKITEAKFFYPACGG